jgi:MoxR-like ATPase
VLVDEIDKAPRDLPNDVLNEIEHLEFFVRETGRRFQALPGFRPILVLTSNSERNLPDAFLRRCVFYHISFPSEEKLKEIVQRRLQPDDRFSPGMVNRAIARFEEIRRMPLSKRPATAECLAWIQVLERMQIDPGNLKPGQAETLAISYSVLAKSQEDLEKIMKAFSART